MFCFPNLDHVIFSREFALVHRTTFEINSSLWYLISYPDLTPFPLAVGYLGTRLYGTITCSEMGKQNIQAKKYYSVGSVGLLQLIFDFTIMKIIVTTKKLLKFANTAINGPPSRTRLH